MKTGEIRRRLRDREQAFDRRLDDVGEAKREAATAWGRLQPRWLLVGGFGAGLLMGALSVRALAATAAALTSVTVRLMNTPLGSMAIGAVAARRRRRRAHEQLGDDAGGH